MANTINGVLDEILEQNRLVLGHQKKDSTYISNAADGKPYPYRVIQGGSDDYFAFDETLSGDLRTLAAYMSTVSFFNSLVNNALSYKDCTNTTSILEEQKKFAEEWKLMLDQLRNIVPDVICRGGIVAVPNLDWIRGMVEPTMKNPTDVRREFSAAMRACITLNYKEAEHINEREHINIKCSEEYRDATTRIVSDQAKIAKKGGNGKGD